MENKDQSYNAERVDDYLHFELMKLKCKLEANETLLWSLHKTILENAPDLIDQVKTTLVDVSETNLRFLKIQDWRDENIENYNNEIKQHILKLELIRESSKYTNTFIDIESKN